MSGSLLDDGDTRSMQQHSSRASNSCTMQIHCILIKPFMRITLMTRWR